MTRTLKAQRDLAQYTAIVLVVVLLGLLPTLFDDACPRWVFAVGIQLAICGLLLMASVNRIDRALEQTDSNRKSD